MRRIRGKLAGHIGDHVVLSPEWAVLVTSPGTKSSYPRPPQSLNPSGKRLAARLRAAAGVTSTVPRLVCPLVALGAAEAGVGAGPGASAGAGAGTGVNTGGDDDPFGLIPPGEIPAGGTSPGEVTPCEAC